ncbi:hypothetical protein BDZ91DRAFT_371508 [Kalaharituber pfeilii]|nr:hypothetical protein BDZ91DRAFT_371508 [Kalaharituber pfeilii]
MPCIDHIPILTIQYMQETRHLKLIPLPKKAKAPTDINDSLSNRWYQLLLAVPATFLISFELFPTHYFQLFSVMPF